MDKEMKRIIIIILALIVAAGCKTNLFTPFHSPENDVSLSSLLADGDAAMENGDFESALGYYDKAVSSYPGSGKARLGYCAAYIAFKDFDMLELMRKLEGENLQGTDPLFEAADRAFYDDGARIVFSNLLPVAEGTCDIPGSDTETNINIAFSSILLGALAVSDIDDNGNFADSYEILYITRDIGVLGFGSFPSLSPLGKSTVINNINSRIDDVLYYIGRSTAALDHVYDNLNLDEVDENMLDDLHQVAETAARTVEYYRYKDEKDNDGDAIDTDMDSIQEKMIWTDSNANGTIDDPIGDPWTYDRVSLLPLPLDATWYSLSGGEWTGGDWGVDEELIDGDDNDGDGTVDEDSGGYK
mgnify:CR=1 FL=1